MMDLTKLPAADAERIADAEGFTGTAALFARIADAEALADPDMEDRLRDELDDAVLDRDVAENHAEELQDVLRAALAWFDQTHADQPEPEWVDEAREVLS